MNDAIGARAVGVIDTPPSPVTLSAQANSIASFVRLVSRSLTVSSVVSVAVLRLTPTLTRAVVAGSLASIARLASKRLSAVATAVVPLSTIGNHMANWAFSATRKWGYELTLRKWGGAVARKYDGKSRGEVLPTDRTD